METSKLNLLVSFVQKLLCFSYLAALSISASQAANWTLQPRLNASQDFSDNIGLDSEQNKVSDTVTTVTPSIRLTGRGSRLTLTADYQISKRLYEKSDNPNGFDHNLLTSASSELVKDQIYLEGRASFSQQNIDELGSANRDNVNNNGNRQDVYTYGITPIFRHHFGNTADAEVRYSFEHLVTDTTQSSTDMNSTTARLSSGSNFGKYGWSLIYSSEENKSENSTTTQEQLTADLSYQFNRKYAGFVTLGRDKNDFPSSREDSIDGNRWIGGLIWTPTNRTSLRFGLGQRYEQPMQSLNFSHRARRILITASYAVQNTSSQAILLDSIFRKGNELLSNVGFTGFIVSDNGGVESARPVTSASELEPGQKFIAFDDPGAEQYYEQYGGYELLADITDEIIETKNFNVALRYTGRRTTGNFALFQNRRLYQVSPRDEEINGFNFNVNRRLSALSSASVFGDWQRSENSTDGQATDTWSIGLSANKRLSEYLSLDAKLRHSVRDSSSLLSNSKENRATIAINVRI